MSTQAHIVVVDDEPELRGMVQEYLLQHGYTVSEADGGRALRALIAERPVDLVLLDVNMPEEDGLTIARYLRAHGRVGIIMLTANRDTIDKVVGLEVGADDYLAKPFDLRELLARVRSVLRRLQVADEPPATMGHEVRFGRCVLNLDSHRMYAPDGREVPLTPMEFELLAAFARNPNRVMSRDRLLELAHGRDHEPFDRSIDTRIARLRRKVEPSPAHPSVIKTMRGAGYMFAPAKSS
jgi:DNA-binding response OmpR family regulator